MNKYQEALNHIGDISIVSGYDPESDRDEYTYVACSHKYADDMLKLQEAVAKADKYDELMKPKKMKSIEFDGLRTYGNCPNCDSFHIKDGSTHCPHCGQSLEWEEGEKK